jgi:hypothetical protein
MAENITGGMKILRNKEFHTQESTPEADSSKILGWSELCHNSKDGIFTVVKRL